MMASTTLLELTLVLSLALLLVAALRPLLRGLGGAAAAYASWALVPLVLVSILLPHPPATLGMREALPMPLAALPRILHAAPVQQAMGSDRGGLDAWLLLWLAGACSSAVLLGWQQVRFVRMLGPLRAAGPKPVFYSDSAAAGPALLGLLRPRIVLPADFAQRYTDEEQALIVLHERIHLRRGDLYANAACSVLQVLFWFHPLLHLAARAFRLDQELACDASVLRHHTHSRRVYAGAILKTQLAAAGVPVGCNWQSRHPLKGRIMSLTRPSPKRSARLLGTGVLAISAALACYSAWAAAADSPAAPADPVAQQTAELKAANTAARAEAAAAGMAEKAAASAKVLAGTAAKKQAAAAKQAAALAKSDTPTAPDAQAAGGQLKLEATYSVDGLPEQKVNMIGMGGEGSTMYLGGTAESGCVDEWQLTPYQRDTVMFRGKLVCKGVVLASPSVMLKLDQRGAVEFKGDGAHPGFKLDVVVSRM
ncbi:MAG: M56 family metallopeptidase [Pseudomonadota bacterium]